MYKRHCTVHQVHVVLDASNDSNVVEYNMIAEFFEVHYVVYIWVYPASIGFNKNSRSTCVELHKHRTVYHTALTKSPGGRHTMLVLIHLWVHPNVASLSTRLFAVYE